MKGILSTSPTAAFPFFSFLSIYATAYKVLGAGHHPSISESCWKLVTWHWDSNSRGRDSSRKLGAHSVISAWDLSLLNPQCLGFRDPNEVCVFDVPIAMEQPLERDR